LGRYNEVSPRNARLISIEGGVRRTGFSVRGRQRLPEEESGGRVGRTERDQLENMEECSGIGARGEETLKQESSLRQVEAEAKAKDKLKVKRREARKVATMVKRIRKCTDSPTKSVENECRNGARKEEALQRGQRQWTVRGTRGSVKPFRPTHMPGEWSHKKCCRHSLHFMERSLRKEAEVDENSRASKETRKKK
jgi:hypothetical protein